MITTDFRCPLQRFMVVRPSIVARQCCAVRPAQVRLLASCNQLAGILQSRQLLGIARQKVRDGEQSPNANYRQHDEQGHHGRAPVHKSFVKLNLRNAFLRFAAFIAVVIKNDVPHKRRNCLMLAHMVEFYLQFTVTYQRQRSDDLQDDVSSFGLKVHSGEVHRLSRRREEDARVTEHYYAQNNQDDGDAVLAFI